MRENHHIFFLVMKICNRCNYTFNSCNYIMQITVRAVTKIHNFSEWVRCVLKDLSGPQSSEDPGQCSWLSMAMITVYYKSKKMVKLNSSNSLSVQLWFSNIFCDFCGSKCPICITFLIPLRNLWENLSSSHGIPDCMDSYLNDWITIKCDCTFSFGSQANSLAYCLRKC